MSLQGIINTAVNIEINRSKLVAQSVSRSGRVLTAARNWSNPFRFVVTPRPIWKLTDTVKVRESTITVRAMIEEIYEQDRVNTSTIFLSDLSASTGAQVATTMDWLVQYQGAYPRTNGVLNSVTGDGAGDAASGNRMFIGLGGTPPATDTYIVRKGDWIRPGGNPFHLYPYIVQEDIVVPPTASNITGTITSTDIETTITGVSSTTNLRVGQRISETGVNTGSFGGSTFITAISGTTVSIQSTTPNTAGAITFDGSNTVVAIPIHRGFIPQTGYTYSGSTIIVGYRAARFSVKITKLPAIRYLPGQFVEFNGDFEMIEEIL